MYGERGGYGDKSPLGSYYARTRRFEDGHPSLSSPVYGFTTQRLMARSSSQGESLNSSGGTSAPSQEDTQAAAEDLLGILRRIRSEVEEKRPLPQADAENLAKLALDQRTMLKIIDQRIERTAQAAGRPSGTSGERGDSVLNVVGEALVQDLLAEAIEDLLHEREEAWKANQSTRLAGTDSRRGLIRLRYQLSQIRKDRDKIVSVMIRRENVDRLDYSRAKNGLVAIMLNHRDTHNYQSPQSPPPAPVARSSQSLSPNGQGRFDLVREKIQAVRDMRKQPSTPSESWENNSRDSRERSMSQTSSVESGSMTFKDLKSRVLSLESLVLEQSNALAAKQVTVDQLQTTNSALAETVSSLRSASQSLSDNSLEMVKLESRYKQQIQLAIKEQQEALVDVKRAQETLSRERTDHKVALERLQGRLNEQIQLEAVSQFNEWRSLVENGWQEQKNQAIEELRLSMQKEIDDLNQKNAESVSLAAKELHSAKQMESIQQELEKLTSERDDLKQTLLNTENRLRQLEAQSEEKVKDAENLKGELEQSKKMLQDTRDGSSSKTMLLESELQQERAKLADLMQENTLLGDRLSRVETKLTQSASALQTLEAEKEQLRRNLRETAATSAVKMSELQQARDQLLAELDQSAKAKEDALRSRSNTIEHEMQSRIDVLEQQNHSLEGQLDALSTSLENARISLEMAQRRCDESAESKGTILMEIEKVRNENLALSDELESARSSLSSALTELASRNLEQSNHNDGKSIEEITLERDKLEQQLEEERKRMAGHIQESRRGWEKKNADLILERDELIALVEKLSGDVDSGKNSYATVQAELVATQDMVQNLNLRLDEKNNQVELILTEGKARSEAIIAEQLASAESKEAQLQEKFALALSQLEREKIDLVSQVEQLQDSLNTVLPQLQREKEERAIYVKDSETRMEYLERENDSISSKLRQAESEIQLARQRAESLGSPNCQNALHPDEDEEVDALRSRLDVTEMKIDQLLQTIENLNKQLNTLSQRNEELEEVATNYELIESANNDLLKQIEASYEEHQAEIATHLDARAALEEKVALLSSNGGTTNGNSLESLQVTISQEYEAKMKLQQEKHEDEISQLKLEFLQKAEPTLTHSESQYLNIIQDLNERITELEGEKRSERLLSKEDIVSSPIFLQELQSLEESYSRQLNTQAEASKRSLEEVRLAHEEERRILDAEMTSKVNATKASIEADFEPLIEDLNQKIGVLENEKLQRTLHEEELYQHPIFLEALNKVEERHAREAEIAEEALKRTKVEYEISLENVTTRVETLEAEKIEMLHRDSESRAAWLEKIRLLQDQHDQEKMELLSRNESQQKKLQDHILTLEEEVHSLKERSAHVQDLRHTIATQQQELMDKYVSLDSIYEHPSFLSAMSELKDAHSRELEARFQEHSQRLEELQSSCDKQLVSQMQEWSTKADSVASTVRAEYEGIVKDLQDKIAALERERENVAGLLSTLSDEEVRQHPAFQESIRQLQEKHAEEERNLLSIHHEEIQKLETLNEEKEALIKTCEEKTLAECDSRYQTTISELRETISSLEQEKSHEITDRLFTNEEVLSHPAYVATVKDMEDRMEAEKDERAKQVESRMNKKLEDMRKSHAKELNDLIEEFACKAEDAYAQAESHLETIKKLEDQMSKIIREREVSEEEVREHPLFINEITALQEKHTNEKVSILQEHEGLQQSHEDQISALVEEWSTRVETAREETEKKLHGRILELENDLVKLSTERDDFYKNCSEEQVSEEVVRTHPVFLQMVESLSTDYNAKLEQAMDVATNKFHSEVDIVSKTATEQFAKEREAVQVAHRELVSSLEQQISELKHERVDLLQKLHEVPSISDDDIRSHPVVAQITQELSTRVSELESAVKKHDTIKGENESLKTKLQSLTEENERLGSIIEESGGNLQTENEPEGEEAIWSHPLFEQVRQRIIDDIVDEYKYQMTMLKEKHAEELQRLSAAGGSSTSNEDILKAKLIDIEVKYEAQLKSLRTELEVASQHYGVSATENWEDREQMLRKDFEKEKLAAIESTKEEAKAGMMKTIDSWRDMFEQQKEDAVEELENEIKTLRDQLEESQNAVASSVDIQQPSPEDAERLKRTISTFQTVLTVVEGLHSDFHKQRESLETVTESVAASTGSVRNNCGDVPNSLSDEVLRALEREKRILVSALRRFQQDKSFPLTNSFSQGPQISLEEQRDLSLLLEMREEPVQPKPGRSLSSELVIHSPLKDDCEPDAQLLFPDTPAQNWSQFGSSSESDLVDIPISNEDDKEPEEGPPTGRSNSYSLSIDELIHQI